MEWKQKKTENHKSNNLHGPTKKNEPDYIENKVVKRITI